MLAADVAMRGSDRQTGSMFSYVSPEALVPPDHPLRPIRVLVNRALERLSGEFDKLYAAGGRDSIAPEKLLRALLLQAFYSVRSERRLMEQITYNMLFRWFIGLSMNAAVWDVTVFTKNRDRLLRGEVAGKFFAALLADPQVKPLLSPEHFSVDGTLIEAWASMKSFRPKDGTSRNGERDFHGEKRSNETHASTTDPDARLARKSNGQASKLCYAGHVVMERGRGGKRTGRSARACRGLQRGFSARRCQRHGGRSLLVSLLFRRRTERLGRSEPSRRTFSPAISPAYRV
jgi:transposase